MCTIVLYVKNSNRGGVGLIGAERKIGSPDASASGYPWRMFVSRSVYRRLPTKTPRSRPTTIPPAAPATMIRVSAGIPPGMVGAGIFS